MTGEEQKRQLVVQSNPLVEAQYKLDYLPQVLMRKIISLIKPRDKDFQKTFYCFETKEFAELIERQTGGGLLVDILRAARALKETPIKFIKGKTILETNWLAAFKYHTNEGWIEFEISSMLESELLEIKEQFTAYYLKNISSLKSQYSIRLYELLRQYVGIGARTIEISDLRGFVGISKNEYRLYADFKRRVLDIAAKEINKKTDIDFKWRPKKHVRKVVAIEFYDIKNKITIPEVLLAILPKDQKENKDVLKNIRKYLELNGEDYVRQKIQYTSAQKPAKWRAYFAAALQNDHGADYQPNQPYLPFLEGENAGIEIKDGMRIEIGGHCYTVEDEHIRKSDGVIPFGTIRQNVLSGQWKIVDKI